MTTRCGFDLAPTGAIRDGQVPPRIVVTNERNLKKTEHWRGIQQQFSDRLNTTSRLECEGLAIPSALSGG
jgi:hypothetical protein